MLAMVLGALAQVAAANVAEARGDLDGDGRADAVVVRKAGAAAVRFAGGPERLVPFTQLSAPRSGLVTIAGDRALIVAEGPDSGEAIWIRVRRRQVEVLERVALFVEDEDTDLRIDVALAGNRLYRFRRMPTHRRCDGEPAWLETEVLAGRRRFTPAPPPLAVPDDAPRIAATPTRPAKLSARQFVLFDPQTASTEAGTTSPDLLGAPRGLADGDLATAWVEGRPGPGLGETIGFRRGFRGAEVAALRLAPSKDRRFNRPKTVALELEGGRWFVVDLPDAPGSELWATLPAPAASSCASIYLMAVYPGDRRRDQTAIAELSVVSQLAFEPGGVAGALAREIAHSGPNAREAETKLKNQSGAAEAIAAEIARGELDGLAALRLRRVLARRGEGAAEIVRGLGQKEAAEADRELFARALQKMGPRAVPDLVAAAREQPLARTVALAALVEIEGPEALAGLIELAGHGDRALRRAVDLALGKRPPAELGALLQAAAAASDAKTQADLYRAAGLLARRGSPAQRETAARALAEALGSAADYERRYRLLVAAGGLADPIAIAAVAAALRSVADSEDPRQVALRRVATSALGENEHPDATPLLVEATRDPDPGVRSRAISALGERDAAAGDAELVANLEGDRWPRVRRAAAGALGTRCARPEPRASLIRAATREDDVAVGQVVLSSLVTCAGAEATDSLLAVALGGHRPTKLRIHAVLQIARIGGEPRATRMLELFDRFVEDSWSSEASLALAQAAAAGLARLGDPRAVKPLARAAGESSFPEIQAAAARALGSFCAPGTAKLLRQLAGSPQIAVSIAAKSSLRQCKQR